MRNSTKQILTRGVACMLSALLCLGCVGTDWMGLAPGSSDGITTALDAHAASLPAGVRPGGVYYDAGMATVKPGGSNGNFDFVDSRSFLAGADAVTLPGTTNVGASPDDPFRSVAETDNHLADYGAAAPDANGTPYFYLAKGVATAGASGDAVDIEWEVWCWAEANGTADLRTRMESATTAALAQALWDGSDKPWELARPKWVSGTEDYFAWQRDGTYNYNESTSGQAVYGADALTWSADPNAVWSVIRTEPYRWGVDYAPSGGVHQVAAKDSPNAGQCAPGLQYIMNPFGAASAMGTVIGSTAMDFMLNTAPDGSLVAVHQKSEGDGQLYMDGVAGFLDYVTSMADASHATFVDVGTDVSPGTTQAGGTSDPATDDASDATQPGGNGMFQGGIQGGFMDGPVMDGGDMGPADKPVEPPVGNPEFPVDPGVDPGTDQDATPPEGDELGGSVDPAEPEDPNPEVSKDNSEGGGTELSEQSKGAPITDPTSIQWHYPAYDVGALLSELYANAKAQISGITAGTPVGRVAKAGGKGSLSAAQADALAQLDEVRGVRIYGMEAGVMTRPGGIWYGAAENGDGALAFRSADPVLSTRCANTQEELDKAGMPYVPGAARYAKGIRVDGGDYLGTLMWPRAYANGAYSGAMLFPEDAQAGADVFETISTMAASTEVYDNYDTYGFRAGGAQVLDGAEPVLQNTQIPMEIRAELFFDVTKDYQRGHGVIKASGTPTASADPAAITGTQARADSTGAQEAPVTKTSVIVDTVSYSDLSVTARYTLQASVYLVSDFDASGTLRTGAKAVSSVGPVYLAPQGTMTVNRELTAADNNGTVDVAAGTGSIQVRFPAIDTTGTYANQQLVVRQVLMDGTNSSAHGSNRTPEQIVTFRSDVTGLIGAAYSGTSKIAGTKYIDGVDNEIIRDDVTWSNLAQGGYLLEGLLYNKSNGKKLNLPAQRATFQVGANQATGTVSMDFPLSGGIGKSMRGGDIVVGQYLYKQGTANLDTLIADAGALNGAGADYDAWLARVRAYADVVRNRESRPGTLASLCDNAVQYSANNKTRVVNGLSDLKNNKNVVMDGYELVLAYDSMSNAAQTVHVQLAGVDTEFTDATTRGHSIIPSDNIQVLDKISYRNLVPGCEYEILVEVVDRRTGKPFADDNGVESVLPRQIAEATATDAVFDARMEFRNMAGKLVGKDAVSMNYLYRVFRDARGQVVYREEVVSETDLSNARQTMTFAKDSNTPVIVSTTALNAETRTQTLPIGSAVTVRDLVEYAGLEPRQTYSLVTEVYDRTDDRILRSVGSIVNEFTPRYSTGTESVEFSMDTSDLAGHKLVIYETLCEGARGRTVLDTHDDPNDSNQTLRVGQDNGNPYIDTSAAAGSRDGTLIIDKNAVIVDTVNYMNLTPGARYTLTGQIWNKSTGKLVRDVEPVVTEFVAGDSGQGSVDVRFVLDTTGMEGVDLVVGETLTDRRGQVVAEHVDLNDAYQTVRVGAASSQAPSIGTTAMGERHDSTVICSESAVITDSVYYYNLTPGESYTLSTRLMRKSDGTEIKDSAVTTVLRPSVASGVIQVAIPVDTSKLAGQSLVVYETLSLAGREVAYHEDLNDSAQTVTVRPEGDEGSGPAAPDTTDPWVNGTATDAANGGHTLTLSGNAVIRVAINYGNLKGGKAYTVTANVQDVTKAELTNLGPKSVQFTAAEGGRGTVSLDIPVDTTRYVGHELAVYLTINDGNTPLASHNDLADEYLKVAVAKATTLLTGADGTSKSVAMSANTTLKDTIYFGNLTPGKSYTVSGYIIDLDGPPQQQASSGTQANRPSSGQNITQGNNQSNTQGDNQGGDGNLSLSEDFQAASPAGQLTAAGGVVIPYNGEYIATASAAFTPTEASGTTSLDFNVNTAGRNGHRLVCCEVVTDGNYVVAIHVDTADKDQTVTVRTQVSAQTGATPIRMAMAIVSAVMTCVFGVYTMQAVVRRRRLGE